jgi:hypothetical protein
MVAMGNFPCKKIFPVEEPGIKPGTSWLLVRNFDHQATRLDKYTIKDLRILKRSANRYWLHNLRKEFDS